MAEKKTRTKKTDNPELPPEDSISVNNYDFDSDVSGLDQNLPRSVTLDKDTLLETTKARLKKKKVRLPEDLSDAKRLEPDHKEGLTSEQVALRMDEGYINFSAKKNGKSYLGIFLSNIFTFFNILTFIVAIAMLIAGIEQFTEIFFVLIIFANICIGIFQEIKAKRSVDRLKLITAPTAVVVRDGQKQTIKTEEVVLDDIIHFETGKQICADSVIVSGDVEVNESVLTGESVPVKKRPGETLYSGSFISSGNCYCRVDKIGAFNYVEVLSANAKKYKKPRSELNSTIRTIMKVATIFIVPISIIMIVTGMLKPDTSWQLAIKTTSGAIIGMIPAGMFLLTSVALFVSVIRLAGKKTLVQDLYCIEMLARVDTLCFDKTGTITDGSMSVNKVIKFKSEEVTSSIETIIGSMLSATEDNNQTALALAEKFGYNTELVPEYVQPFSSQRKYSLVSFEDRGTYILGAPEFVLKDAGVRMEKLINENAAEGYRVIVLAHSPQTVSDDTKLPASRKALCLVVLEDHIRDDAMQTIQWFKENDVAVKVISGDNPITVSEVARRVGVDNADLYISLDGLSDREIVEAADKYTVFGRVTPDQKSLLVKSLKAKGHTVAMTGDGVNDILAMREADCAVAIASGAEAARNVSHLVLLDNNFTSMPDIVLEGRRVVNNIQKSSSLFLMKTIMSMALALIFTLMRETYPLKTENLLLLEILVIGVPSFALALQPNKNRIQGKFIANVIGRAIPGGLALIMSVLSVYWYNKSYITPVAGSTLYTTMLVTCLTFTGFVVLCKICEPYNFYRAFLTIVCGILIAVLLCFFGGAFKTNLMEILTGFKNDQIRACLFFMISIILGSYFVITIIMKLLKRANLLFD